LIIGRPAGDIVKPGGFPAGGGGTPAISSPLSETGGSSSETGMRLLGTDGTRCEVDRRWRETAAVPAGATSCGSGRSPAIGKAATLGSTTGAINRGGAISTDVPGIGIVSVIDISADCAWNQA
jgi:hypothetical protein